MVATQWLFNFVVAQAVPHMCVRPFYLTILHLSSYHEANTSTRLATVGKAGYGTYFVRTLPLHLYCLKIQTHTYTDFRLFLLLDVLLRLVPHPRDKGHESRAHG